jgi:hypothetical protein
MKKIQRYFKNYNEQNVEFINISFRLIIFMISIAFLVEIFF